MFQRSMPICCLAALLLAVQSATAQVPSKPGDWPQWRGPNRDGVSQETGLLREWPEGGPRLAWQIETAGTGYSSMSVKDGIIFTQGDLEGVEQILAIRAADGTTVWAVQPAPVLDLLTEQLVRELKNLDRNQDGEVDELEALQRFGWEFNKFDKPVEGADASLFRSRAEAVFSKLDKNSDGKLDFAEAGNLLRDQFERADAEDKQADAAQLARSRSAEVLAQLDKDANGSISQDEARNTLISRHFGRIDQREPSTDKQDGQLKAEELEVFFSKQQPGRDGLITLTELIDLYVRNPPRGDGKLSLDELRIAFGGYRNGMGDGPRGTPTVDGDRIYAEGGNGDMTCLDAATGRTIWYVNLSRDFGGRVPGWGYCESPLVVEERVIVTPGGKDGTLAALDKRTGKVIWRSGEVTEGAHYSSPVLAEIGGVRQIVQFARESVFGVSIDDGKFLWRYTSAANGTANCCTPIVDQDHVLASSSYGVGGGLAKIVAESGKFSAEEVYFEKKLACHHGGIVKIGNWIYSNAGGPLLCMEFLTGKIAWQSRSVGKGSLVAADGMLYVLGENHEVGLVEATPEEYVERGRFKIASHGHPAWAHPVVAGGRLYLRDQGMLAAYDLKN